MQKKVLVYYARPKSFRFFLLIVYAIKVKLSIVRCEKMLKSYKKIEYLRKKYVVKLL